MSRASILALAALLTTPALAQDVPDDVRQVDLVDGRTLWGGVVTTEPAGIRLRIPQGETVVGFHQLKNIKPSDGAAWLGQRVWEVVVVGPDDERHAVEQAIRTYSSIKLAGEPGIPRPLSAGAVNNTRACAPSDLPCAVRAADRADAWSWIVTVEPTADGGGVLRSTTSLDSAADQVSLSDLRDAEALLTGLDQLLDLSAVRDRAGASARLQAALGAKASKEKPPKDKVAKAPKVKTPKEPKQSGGPVASVGMEALVPIPGYPALKRGDMTAFGVSLGVAVPTTVAWIGATGSQAQSLPEHAALAVGGYYLSTVVINHVVGAHLKRTGVAIGPAERGRGASLQVRVQLQ